MDIITLSCGIGRSFQESMKAVKKAKKSKSRKEHNIVVYGGRRLRSTIPEKFKAKTKLYIKLAKTLSKKQKNMLDKFALHDSMTGLLNKTGFVLRLMELQSMKINEGYYLLFDLDDLHYWNEKRGYAAVDRVIEIAGKEITKNIRHNRERVADVLGHRLHESAGDEFLVFLPGKHTPENLNIFINKAKRIMYHFYKRQRELK